MGHCGEEPLSPLSGYVSERLYTIPQGAPAYYTEPGIQEHWDDAYWAEVKRGGRPGRALTSGPGPSAYHPPGWAHSLPWRYQRGRHEGKR